MDMLRMPTASRSRFAVRRKVSWLGLLLGLVLGGWGGGAQAFFSLGMIPGIYVPQWYYKHGAVYTRAIVPGPTGRPVYVEYDTSGKEAREIGEAIGQYERAQVMSGDVYRAFIQRQKDARERYPTALVMTAAEYRGKTFKTVTGETINKPSLQPSSLTVMVRPDKELFTTTGTELLLLQLPIKDGVTPDASSKSLLLSPEGAILNQTANTIGFRVGFFSKDGKVADTMTRDRDAKIYGPMPGVGVSLGGYITGGYALTNNEGRYSMQYYLPACPGFVMEYTTPAYLELQYKRFNPRGGAYMPYYMTRMDYDFCNGLGVYSLSAAMIIATAATPIKRPMDFPVDLMVLDGTATLKNAKVGDSTAYSAETSDRERYLQEKYDFDGDEKPEFVVPGKKVTKTVDGKPKEAFVTTSVKEAELQGIYLSSRYDSAPENTEETAPDLTRLIDTAPDFKDRGLLDSITKEDLKDTDIYVFRESNGQLVAERRGLHEDELYKSYSGVDEAKEAFRFSIQLRGSVENYYAISGRTGEAAFAKWQSAGGFKEEFQKRNANHLKAGEQVRIIAINRPTGYVGSKTFQLQSSLSGNIINVNSQLIQMGPPNLKVWAERKSKIEAGMTKGEQKKQLIGNEGAGLGSDISIAIYTDWRDADGSPLPEELADYGYTGRLAKIVAANQLAPVGANSLSQFKIKPGQQVQVIQLPEKVLAKQHLYLQVTGQPENRNPDFSSKGQASGILKYRPTHYVPVQVPLHDEEASELSRQAYSKAKDEFPELNLKAPQPTYTWKYRPEMQFSLYDLNVKEIRRTTADDKTTNVKDNKTPTFASSDKLISLLYDLVQSALPSLDSWDHAGEREMVIAFGQEEVKAKIGEGNQVKFENIEHLSNLDADDYLSIRLYANNDMANVLYEFAFDYVALDTQNSDLQKLDEEFFEISADSTEIPLQGWIVGYANRPSSSPKPSTTWSLEGSGNLTTPGKVSGNAAGYFQNTLKLPRTAGSIATVVMKEDDSQTEARLGPFKVIPGETNSIVVSTEGKTHVFAHGEMTFTARLQDKYGNAVADGTVVDWRVSGNADFVSKQAFTNNGVAKAVVVGGGETGDITVTARSGSVEKLTVGKVLPLTVALTAPTEVIGGNIFAVTVAVTDSDGKAVSDVSYEPNSTVGRVEVKRSSTGADGRATFNVRTVRKYQQGVVGVRIGEQLKKSDVLVRIPPGATSAATNTMLVGDSMAAGMVQANWVDNINIDVPYAVEEQLKIRGIANERINLKLGSGGILNIAPLLTYPLTGVLEGDLVVEANGRDSAIGKFVDMVKDSPFGVGNSLQFKKENRLEVEGKVTYVPSAVVAQLLDKVKTAASTEFKVDLKFTENAGQVLALGEGQSLALTDAGELIYTVKTESDERSLTSKKLSANVWYNVIARYDGANLRLTVNAQDGITEISSGSTQLSGAVAYGTATDIVIGGGFEGRLRGFDLYDLNGPALLTFANGSDTAQVVLDDQGVGSVGIRSTGELESLVAAEARDNFIRKIPVEMQRSAQPGQIDVDYITLLTRASYQAVLETYTSSVQLPPEAIAAYTNSPQYEPFNALPGLKVFPVAYAGWSDWVPSVETLKEMGTKGLEIAGEAVSWVVPYDDAIIIAQQVEYWNNGSPEYNPMLLAASSLSVLSIFPLPFTKALKFVMKPVKKLAGLIGKGKFGIAFGKKFLQLAKECIDGRGKGLACQTLEAVIPFVESIGIMYLTDEAAFKEMVASLDSEEDFLTLFNFALLGIDLEWFGLSEAETPPDITLTMSNPLGLRVAYASAAGDMVRKSARGILGSYKKLKKDGVIDEKSSFFKILNPISGMNKWLSQGNRKDITKRIVNVKFLKVIGKFVRRGKPDLIFAMVKGYSGQRIPQPVVWGMMYYLLVNQDKYFTDKGLEDRLWGRIGLAFFDIALVGGDTTPTCPIDPPDTSASVVVKEQQALTSPTDRKRASRTSQANGALYHLSQIATLRLMGKEVSGIEVKREVKLYTGLKGADAEYLTGNYERDADIVSGVDGKLLIEAKSLSAVKAGRSIWKSYYFSEWSGRAGRTSLMRQFLLDRVDAKKEDPTTRIRWYFDTFQYKATSPCGGRSGGFFIPKDINDARETMAELPSWFSDYYIKKSTGYTKAQFKKAYSTAVMNQIVLADSFMQTGFKVLIEEGHSLVAEGEVDAIVSQIVSAL
jgi:hypothetical protein